jgi:hypothetical protein
MNRIQVLIMALAVSILYCGVALSPARKAIGRNHPGIAAFLSPPLFNFSETYTSGNVRGFAIGMSKTDVLRTLGKNFAGQALILPGCVGKRADAYISTEKAVELPSQLTTTDRLCVYPKSSREILEIEFHFDLVSRISATYVTIEGT